MSIEIRYLDRTCLTEEAFYEVVYSYIKSLKIENDVRIVFDLRIIDFGFHIWEPESNQHIIRISPTKCQQERGVKLHSTSEKYRVISTLLHELKHAQQKEKLGWHKYFSEGYRNVKGIKNTTISNWYSECERDARMFEDKHIEEAVEIYDSCEDERD